MKKNIINKIFAAVLTAMMALLITFRVNADSQSHIDIGSTANTVNVGTEFVIQLDLEEMTVSTFTGGVSFDESMVELIAYSGNDGSSIAVYDADGYKTRLSAGHGDGTVGFYFAGISDNTYMATEGFLFLKFRAIQPGNISFGVYESSSGQDGINLEVEDMLVITAIEDSGASSGETDAPLDINETSPVADNGYAEQSVPAEWFEDVNNTESQQGAGFTPEAESKIIEAGNDNASETKNEIIAGSDISGSENASSSTADVAESSSAVLSASETSSAEAITDIAETENSTTDVLVVNENRSVFPWWWIAVAAAVVAAAVVIISFLIKRKK